MLGHELELVKTSVDRGRWVENGHGNQHAGVVAFVIVQVGGQPKPRNHLTKIQIEVQSGPKTQKIILVIFRGIDLLGGRMGEQSDQQIIVRRGGPSCITIAALYGAQFGNEAGGGFNKGVKTA